MKNGSLLMSKGFSVVLGFFIAPLISSILYALVTHSNGYFVFTLLATLLVAYTITVLFMLPAYLTISAKSKLSLTSVSLLSFGIVFCLFFGYLLYAGAQATTLINGGNILVEQDKITLAGYRHYLLSATKIALFSLLGGLIFYYFAKKAG